MIFGTLDLWALIISCSCLISLALCGSESILLTDVKTLTLYNGRMTNSRRSGPVPQLKCTGGSAGCHEFVPQVVQCYNRGTDGYDVQWECKTDMDNAYRFGRIDVSCEGYQYTDDPYILHGSCGLEYTLDLTKEGHQKQGHSYNGDSNYNHGSNYGYNKSKFGSGIGDLLMLAIIGLVLYGLYRAMRSPREHGYHDYSTTNDDYPGYPGAGGGDGGQAPPPAGFRPEYTPRGGAGPDSCGGSQNRGGAGGAGSGFGGFWSGAATGGILGYLMGNTANRGPMYNRPFGGGPSYRSPFGGGGGGSSFGGSGSSSGTRTASGFGGTRRR